MNAYNVAVESINTDLVGHYEVLRKSVLDHARRPFCGGRGLAVFIRRGMATWMELWNTKDLDDYQARIKELPVAGDFCSGAPQWQSQLVDVLADLALSKLTEALS